MSTITVVRHVPPPIIGMCGVRLDRATATLENDLDDEEVVSRGGYPTRSTLAHLAGQARHGIGRVS